MKSKDGVINSKQLVFQEIFVGTLIYVTVLGFFGEYTSIVYVKDFSTLFLASAVLEVLTFLAFQLEERIVSWLKNKQGALYRILLFVCVWLVLFLSKFIFILVLDLLFKELIYIKGFFGILAVVLSVTLIHKLAYKIFNLLGDTKSQL